ncbi:hypothetical protein [Streptomyces sp. JCM 35825]|uniref:hypothetical protein n=1 Tax=Streptomyces sp. JCM 35825 TaxID=2930259 RepID=UPI002349CDB2|nr:hypothetical protein [Streptomyces sp. JCM 35825]WCL89618.1 hypothetical protein PPN52_36310 [Streptomyces sp. JCM 35825]
MTLTAASLAITLLTPSAAFAWGTDPGEGAKPPAKDSAKGTASGTELGAEVTRTRIVVTQSGGGTVKPSAGGLTAVDPNWKPPACWYEPLATSRQLKDATEKMNKGDLFSVNFGRRWGKDLLVDAFDKGDATFTDTPTKNYNVGKKGMFWRAVAREDRANDPEILDCSKNLFWQKVAPSPTTRTPPPRSARGLRLRQDPGPGHRSGAQAAGQVDGEPAHLGVAGQGRLQGRHSARLLAPHRPVCGDDCQAGDAASGSGHE